MEKPVTYKRTATRRESFRIDFDADEVRTALSNTILDEDIPDTAAFQHHEDGGATFCWDVDSEVDPSSNDIDETDETDEPVEPPPPTCLRHTGGHLSEHKDLFADEPCTCAEIAAAGIQPPKPWPRATTTEKEQCEGIFMEGATREFRCHLDKGHDGQCRPAEGCEPEDPPKGRRRSW